MVQINSPRPPSPRKRRFAQSAFCSLACHIDRFGTDFRGFVHKADYPIYRYSMQRVPISIWRSFMVELGQSPNHPRIRLARSAVASLAPCSLRPRGRPTLVQVTIHKNYLYRESSWREFATGCLGWPAAATAPVVLECPLGSRRLELLVKPRWHGLNPRARYGTVS